MSTPPDAVNRRRSDPPAWSPLSVRDLVALSVIVARTIAQYHSTSAKALVQEAFDVADEFVTESEGGWSEGARQNHVDQRAQRERKGTNGRERKK